MDCPEFSTLPLSGSLLKEIVQNVLQVVSDTELVRRHVIEARAQTPTVVPGIHVAKPDPAAARASDAVLTK
jgi:hypothetical protein